jgi:2,3-bisphosphoglycerate-dependent phosphoglycerate mutase
VIKAELEQDKDLLIVAHGNSLRAMLIILGDQTPDTINEAELPTGVPLVLEIENGSIQDRYFLKE